jgi:hypothetical protein
MQDKPDILDRTGWSKAMKSDISQIIYNETDLDQSQADDLAGLIAEWVGGKCEWIEEKDYRTPSCRTGVSFGKKWDFPFCPCCGRKIGVKEKEDE